MSKTKVTTKCNQKLQHLFGYNLGTYNQGLTITDKAWCKINCYINLVGNYEVTGIGKIEVIDGKNTVTDVAILKQEVSSAYVRASDTGITDFLIDNQLLGEAELWSLDWHSHVDMGVFASVTDTKNYEQMFLSKNRTSFPFIIVNKKQEIYSAEYFGDDYYVKIPTIKNELGTPLDLSLEEFERIYSECEADVDTLVTKQIVVATKYTKPYTKQPTYSQSNLYKEKIQEYDQYGNIVSTDWYSDNYATEDDAVNAYINNK